MLADEKYDQLADSWSDGYANPELFYSRRTRLVCELGPALRAGDRVLEIGCADGGLTKKLLAEGLELEAIDVSPKMVERARGVVERRAHIEVGDMNTYEPGAPVAATIGFRVLPYAVDLAQFFSHVGAFSDRKILFDLVPSTGPTLELVESALEQAGFRHWTVRPWLLPARTPVAAPLRPLVYALERSGPVARAITRRRFSVVVAAWGRQPA